VREKKCGEKMVKNGKKEGAKKGVKTPQKNFFSKKL
jgi:hypothetical protein